MTDLAQRLNELALANSNGLLNDDEYRVLRQNAFEEYSVNLAVPTEVPFVSISSSAEHTPLSAPAELLETPKPTPSSSRPKSNIATGVTSLLGKACTPKHTSGQIPRDVHTPGRESPLKLSAMFPKLLQRKPTYRRSTETPRPLKDALNASRTVAVGASTTPSLPPFILPRSTRNKSNLSLHIPQDSPSTSSLNHKEFDIFNDSNLSTSNDIRIVISQTEDELHKLIDAFTALEARTQAQIISQKAHRLPTTTPASVDILLEGKEWREHRRIPSTPRSAPPLDSSRHLIASRTRESLDRTSLRSASSNKTDLSQPLSTASPHRSSSVSRSILGPPTAGSPLQVSALLKANSKRDLTGPWKNSISSTSVSSFRSRLGMTSRNEGLHPPSPTARTPGSQSPNLWRSRSQLGLNNLMGSSWMVSQETLLSASSSNKDESGQAASGETQCENDPALMDIRRRKEKLIARYNARLEFLRAKLKSAELHERLLRK